MTLALGTCLCRGCILTNQVSTLIPLKISKSQESVIETFFAKAYVCVNSAPVGRVEVQIKLTHQPPFRTIRAWIAVAL